METQDSVPSSAVDTQYIRDHRRARQDKGTYTQAQAQIDYTE